MKNSIKQITKNTYVISEWGMAGKVMMFLLVGEERALLCDSGYGGIDLPSIIRTVTSKPVTLICTHGHIDHAMGAYMFGDAYLHSADFGVYEQHSDKEFINSAFGKVHPGIWKLAGMNEMEVEAFKKRVIVHAPATLKPVELIGETIDLGNRKIRIIHTPGHTQGSIMLTDENTRMLFSGDTLCMNVWLCMPESSSVRQYHDMLSELKNNLALSGFTHHCPCHGIAKEKISRLDKNIKYADDILAGKGKDKYIDTGLAQGYQHKSRIFSGILYTKKED